ncbi:hypothetical protein GQX73_g7827 [Xylaria multiplex]|uniref:Carbohydrate kinase PfkB domain-containing protein n=1 Tax=Xylaria multiplex TaxID=323545 RepID=A0A7C8INM6_9PEZI|nr:hypothetical protein GQX73_g7827 [Xylaria multiplex]
MGQLTSSLKDRILGRHSISEPLPLPQLPTRPPTFVSLGMLCLQEIHCSDGQVQRNVLGGPGLWATFGARLFKTWNDSIDVGYIVVDYANVLRYVDVFSPNHHELARLTVGSENESETFSHRSIETQAREFIQSGIGCNQDGLIVVRCGEYGCFFMKDEEVKGWVGTYYNHRVVEVKDVTGAGSAFLGAFTVAFIESGDPRYSCFRGTVAASFALEQFGLPKKETDILRNDHADFIPGFRERWNGFNPFSRLGILQTHPEMFYQKEYPGEDF